jgi:hypothetical protein
MDSARLNQCHASAKRGLPLQGSWERAVGVRAIRIDLRGRKETSSTAIRSRSLAGQIAASFPVWQAKEPQMKGII